MIELLDVKMVLSKSDQIVAISFTLCVKRNVISNITSTVSHLCESKGYKTVSESI